MNELLERSQTNPLLPGPAALKIGHTTLPGRSSQKIQDN
jgi:hypothetical protein